METGRFPDWQPERDTSHGGESRPESGKKRKRRRSDADSAQTRVTRDASSEGSTQPEHRRARRALADILVERRGETEDKQPGHNRRKRPVPLDLFAGTEKKPAADALERAFEEKETGKVFGRVEAETNDPTREAGDKTADRSRAEQAANDAEESGVPHQERDRLRPSELYGGEFVIDLQHNKETEEREIPLHELLLAEVPETDRREAEQEVLQAFSVEQRPERDTNADHDEVESTPVTESASEQVPGFEITPPTVLHNTGQLGRARAYEVHQPDEFVSTATPQGIEFSAVGMPEVDSATANPGEVPAGFQAVQAAEVAHRSDPAEEYPMYMHQPTFHAARSNPGEPMVAKQEADDAVYYATKAAQGRGLAAGVLVAALWARHRGKKLRRQFNERFSKQEKQLKEIKEEQRWHAAEQAARQAESDRQLAAAEQRYTYAEKQLANRTFPETQATTVAQNEISQSMREIPTGLPNNQRTQLPEQPARSASERQIIPPKQQAQVVNERLNVPPEHRLETSAWHTIEVDARTGRPVEQPTFVYGHEYYQERKHESAPADQRNAVAGEVALVGATSAGLRGGSGSTGGSAGTGANYGTAMPPNIPNATMQGPPPSSPTARVRDARDNLSKATASGPIWPLVVALLVIFVVLIVLLH